MNSIRKKITICLIVTVLAALVAVGTASMVLSYRSTIATVDHDDAPDSDPGSGAH